MYSNFGVLDGKKAVGLNTLVVGYGKSHSDQRRLFWDMFMAGQVKSLGINLESKVWSR